MTYHCHCGNTVDLTPNQQARCANCGSIYQMGNWWGDVAWVNCRIVTGNTARAVKAQEKYMSDNPDSRYYVPCGICKTPVLRQGKGGAFAEYHDCKPVPGEKLDEANEYIAALRAQVEDLKKQLSVAVLMAADAQARPPIDWGKEELRAQRDHLLALLRDARRHVELSIEKGCAALLAKIDKELGQ